MSRAERINWEKSKGFVSLRTFFEQAVKEDEALVEAEEKAVASNPILFQNGRHQTPQTVKNYPQALSYTNDGIEMNIGRDKKASLVNVDGILKIGDIVYQFKRTAVKAVKDGDPKKIAKLDGYEVSNPKDGIYVTKVTIHSVPLSNGRVAQNYGRACEGSSGSPAAHRVIGYEESINEVAYVGDAPCAVCPGGYVSNYRLESLVHMKIRTDKRGIFGSWNGRQTSTQGSSGAFKILRFDRYSPAGFGTEYAYSDFDGSASASSYAQFTVSPSIPTGSLPQIGTTYTYTGKYPAQNLITFIFEFRYERSYQFPLDTAPSDTPIDFYLDQGSSYHRVFYDYGNCQCNI